MTNDFELRLVVVIPGILGRFGIKNGVSRYRWL